MKQKTQHKVNLVCIKLRTIDVEASSPEEAFRIVNELGVKNAWRSDAFTFEDANDSYHLRSVETLPHKPED